MKKIKINDSELQVGDGGIFLYQGKPVVDIKDLENGNFEMRFCDTNEKPLPNSPVIICEPERME